MKIIRQVIPWTITANSSFTLPCRGAARWRLVGVCIQVAATPSNSFAGSVVLLADAGVEAAFFEGGISDSAGGRSVTWACNARTDTVASPTMVNEHALAFLPPDLWVNPWERVQLRSASDLPGASVVITCELEDED
jgi:hypothetical protein